jgi:hypothetical protein
MKRLIGLIVLALLGFYVAWPAWTGYQIKTAIDAGDAATLDRKIDFASVRAGLKPAATVRVSEMFDRMQSQAGPTGSLIATQIKGDVVPKIVETSLATLVTPENLIRVVKDGRAWKESVDSILREQIGKFPGIGGDGTTRGGGLQLPGGVELPGGLSGLADKWSGKALEGLNSLGKKPDAGPAPAPAPSAGGTAPSPAFGIGNVKRFAFLGPLAFEVGVAKDAAASEAEVLVQLAFTGGDWRVVQVVPRM